MFTRVQRRSSSETRSGPVATTTPQQAGEASPRLVAQARLAGLAASSSHSAQLRALQAHANARSLPAGVAAVQRVEVDEEEPLQGRFAAAAQRMEGEEEDPLQARFAAAPVQRLEGDEEEPLQRAEKPAAPDRSGLPSQLKAGIEALSGLSMDHVRVHYNSSQPAQLNALAYAQGSDIHLAPGQERHLPHEAWHVVQQAQGRVRPTMQMKGGVAVNDDAGLEREADVMGAKALGASAAQLKGKAQAASMSSVAQLYRVGYAPNLAGLTVPGGGAGAYNYATFGRPADWYDNTFDRLFERAVNAGRSEAVVVRGTNITMVQCESAGSWHNINDMQIGHVKNWQDYVWYAEPATVREATNAYNDLNNLRLEGPTPNASHDFEAGRDSEDEDDTDGDMSDDDFIDKSDGGVMPPKARALLDEYKAGQSSYYK